MSSEPEAKEGTSEIVGRIGSCVIVEITDPDGTKHTKGTCSSKAARDAVATILERELTLRVDPKVVIDDLPDLTPERPPAAPVTE